MPHLKRGAVRDFLLIAEEWIGFQPARWNKTDFIYTFENGNKLEFFSTESSDKVRGPRRDILFINEANLISKDTYDQLALRTNEEIYIDFNPVSQFWAHDLIDQSDYLILTYGDNEALPASIRDEIESHRGNKSFWKIYGEGQLSEAEGKIYTDWKVIDEIPHEARLERRGLDFGYTNDPTALVAIYKYNNSYILDEEIYSKGLSNATIRDTIRNLQSPGTLVVADSAEPKSIDELKQEGIAILPAIKGQGSVNQGIQFIQNQRISITKRSTNLIKEYQNYCWITDRDGKILNTPEQGLDHCMDAIRYGMSVNDTRPTEEKIKSILEQLPKEEILNRRGFY